MYKSNGFINKTHIYFIFFILTVFCFSSCEGLLEEDPPSLISFENLNEETLEAAITGVYEPMTKSRGRLWESNYTTFLAVQAEYANNRSTWLAPYEEYRFDEIFNNPLNAWKSFYRAIGRANLLIDRVGKSDLDQTITNTAIAEARFIRGILYYYLVRTWGSVPLRTKAVLTADDANAPLAEIDDIYDLIIGDLKFAEDNLPNTTSKPGRATAGAAKVFLADVYLTREKWVDARDKAKEVIDNKVTFSYELESDFDIIFSHSSPTNSSDVFSIKFHEAVGYGSFIPSILAPLGPGDIAKDAGMAARGILLLAARGNCDLIANWDDADPRKSMNLYKELEVNGEMIPVDLEGIGDFAFGKYRDPVGIEETAAGNDFYLMRYADVLLIFAEAENKINGPTDEAYSAINKIRRRAYGLDLNVSSQADLPSGLSQSEFDEMILRERGYEFMLEGKRWFDLVRKDRFDLIQQSKGITPSFVYWQIPPSEIANNGALE